MTEEFSSFFFTLQELLNKGDYETLSAYKDPVIWQGLGNHDRMALGRLFAARAEALLGEGNPRGYDFLERATRLSEGDVKLLHFIGHVYALQKQNEGSLNSALRVFEAALEVDPEAFAVKLSFIEVLLTKGDLLQDEKYLLEAKKRSLELEKDVAKQAPEVQAHFLWTFGKLLFWVGRSSGEVDEFHASSEKLLEAKKLGLHDPEFLRDCGDVYFHLARLMKRENYCLEAIQYYRDSLVASHDCAESWFALALCYCLLYENFSDPKHFVGADISFCNATKLDPNSFIYWLKWGQLQLDYGKDTEDLDSVKVSIEKFMNANTLEANNPTVLSYWAEALVLQGTLTDQVDCFKKAEKLFAKSVMLFPENEDIWHQYGCCYNELGRYFGSPTHHQEAINKFQRGLAVNKNSALLWHGLAYSYFALGDLTGDMALIEKSCHFCAKAMENGAMSQPQCWNDWGVALMKLGEMTHEKAYGQAALEKFENAINLQNSWGGTEECDPELLYNYGCACDFLGDFSEDSLFYEKAVQTLQKVLQVQPTHPYARYNLALSLAHLGELISDAECLERAIELFEDVIARDGEDEIAWNESGLTFMNLGQLMHDPVLPHKSRHCYHQAELKFQKAATLGCAPAYYNLACLSSMARDFHAALFYLEKAANFNALPPREEMMQDDWLAPFRETQDFKAFINHYKPKNGSG